MERETATQSTRRIIVEFRCIFVFFVSCRSNATFLNWLSLLPFSLYANTVITSICCFSASSSSLQSHSRLYLSFFALFFGLPLSMTGENANHFRVFFPFIYSFLFCCKTLTNHKIISVYHTNAALPATVHRPLSWDSLLLLLVVLLYFGIFIFTTKEIEITKSTSKAHT